MKALRIERAIKRIQSLPDSWVRVDAVSRITAGLELCLGVYKGRRGRTAEGWRIKCLGVLEFKIDDMDGGGIALYTGNHPAARQFVARTAVLRAGGDNATAITALRQAHVDAVDDWIPFDRYVDISAIAGKKFVCRGPDFLLRAYAQGLRLIGAQPQVRLRQKAKGTLDRPRVLHFGSSSVVANAFVLEPRA